MTTFTGFITGFKYDRVFLEIEGMPTEAIVEAHHLTNERELLLTDKFSAFIKNLGRPALLGEEWQLELDRLDTEVMRIFCKPVFSSRKPRDSRNSMEGDSAPSKRSGKSGRKASGPRGRRKK